MRTLIAFTALALAAAPATCAQEDFSRIKAGLGRQMIVTEDGLTVAGALTELSPSVLKIGDREFLPGPGLKIERDNGNVVGQSAGIGAAIGATFGFAITRGEARLPAAVLGAAPGILYGALFGLVRDKRTTVYDASTKPLESVAMHIAPIVTAHERGLAISFDLK